MEMDTCAVEVGLLKKKPCAQNAVAKCANCEMALCTKHAVAQLTASKQRTGKFMCAECDRANRLVDTSPTQAPKPVGAAKPAAPPPAKPAAGQAMPKAVPAAKPGAAEAKPAAKPDDTGALEFTPTKK
jgi:hypothetical protein